MNKFAHLYTRIDLHVALFMIVPKQCTYCHQLSEEFYLFEQIQHIQHCAQQVQRTNFEETKNTISFILELTYQRHLESSEIFKINVNSFAVYYIDIQVSLL